MNQKQSKTDERINLTVLERMILRVALVFKNINKLLVQILLFLVLGGLIIGLLTGQLTLGGFQDGAPEIQPVGDGDYPTVGIHDLRQLYG